MFGCEKLFIKTYLNSNNNDISYNTLHINNHSCSRFRGMALNEINREFPKEVNKVHHMLRANEDGIK